MATPDQELIKIIQTKQTFADLAYKEYRSSKYGMTFCCPTNFNNHTNVNEICDWEANSKTLYNESTYTFTTFNLATYQSSGGTVDSWVQFEPTIYSTRRLQNPDIITGTAPSNGFTNYPIVVLSAVYGTTIDAYPDTVRLYAFVMRDVDGLPEIDNPAWLNIINRRDNDNNSPAFFGTGDGSGQWDTPLRRQGGPHELNQWWKFRWIEVSGGGIAPQGLTNPAITLRQNTNSVGEKNGAKPGDYVWLVFSLDGTFNYTKSDGTTNFITISETGSDANSRFNYGYNGSSNVATDNAAFLTGAGGGMGFYLLGSNGGQGGTPQSTPLAAEIRGFTKYANTSIDDTVTDSEYKICNDDSELLFITVKDKNAAAVKDYDVFIDNTHYGKTDASGILIVNIKNASVDTKHIINGCKCFTTTGACNQQKIDIVLSDEVTPVCTNLAIDCL